MVRKKRALEQAGLHRLHDAEKIPVRERYLGYALSSLLVKLPFRGGFSRMGPFTGFDLPCTTSGELFHRKRVWLSSLGK